MLWLGEGCSVQDPCMLNIMQIVLSFLDSSWLFFHSQLIGRSERLDFIAEHFPALWPMALHHKHSVSLCPPERNHSICRDHCPCRMGSICANCCWKSWILVGPQVVTSGVRVSQALLYRKGDRRSVVHSLIGLLC